MDPTYQPPITKTFEGDEEGHDEEDYFKDETHIGETPTDETQTKKVSF